MLLPGEFVILEDEEVVALVDGLERLTRDDRWELLRSANLTLVYGRLKDYLRRRAEEQAVRIRCDY